MNTVILPGVARVSAPIRPSLLWSLGALAALTPFAIDLYLPSLPALARDLGGDMRLAQLSVTLYLGLFAAAQLLMGPLSDRYGRRCLISAGLALFALGGLGCALAPTMGLLLLAQALQAIAVTVPAAVRFGSEALSGVLISLLHDGSATPLLVVMGVSGVLAISIYQLGVRESVDRRARRPWAH